jgi:hypothetical protein
MEIERTNNIQEVIKCLPFEDEIRKKGRDKSKVSDMLMLIKNQMDNPFFGIWIAYDNENKEKILGYTIAILTLIPGFERESILRMVAPTKEIRDKFFEILEMWAKTFRIRTQTITAHKHIKAITRKFNFKAVSVVMERRI